MFDSKYFQCRRCSLGARVIFGPEGNTDKCSVLVIHMVLCSSSDIPALVQTVLFSHPYAAG